MTVSSVSIKPHPELKNWFYVTFVSRKDPIGETRVEMLVSEETLRQWHAKTRHALGYPPVKTVFDNSTD